MNWFKKLADLFRPKTEIHYHGSMTPEQAKAMGKVFDQMNKTFKEMDKLFEELKED